MHTRKRMLLNQSDLPFVLFSILPRNISASVSFESTCPSQLTRILKYHLYARTSDLTLVTNYLSCTYANEMPVKCSPRLGSSDTEIMGLVARVLAGVLSCLRELNPQNRAKSDADESYRDAPHGKYPIPSCERISDECARVMTSIMNAAVWEGYCCMCVYAHCGVLIINMGVSN